MIIYGLSEDCTHTMCDIEAFDVFRRLNNTVIMVLARVMDGLIVYCPDTYKAFCMTYEKFNSSGPYTYIGNLQNNLGEYLKGFVEDIDTITGGDENE